MVEDEATLAPGQPGGPQLPALQPPPLPGRGVRVAAELDERARVFLTLQH
ncbi:hypothetical protein AB0M39_14340 [Streptomyces sp. NPDC051907]